MMVWTLVTRTYWEVLPSKTSKIMTSKDSTKNWMIMRGISAPFLVRTKRKQVWTTMIKSLTQNFMKMKMTWKWKAGRQVMRMCLLSLTTLKTITWMTPYGKIFLRNPRAKKNAKRPVAGLITRIMKHTFRPSSLLSVSLVSEPSSSQFGTAAWEHQKRPMQMVENWHVSSVESMRMKERARRSNQRLN